MFEALCGVIKANESHTVLMTTTNDQIQHSRDAKLTTAIEWPTLFVAVLCYGVFALVTVWASGLGAMATIGLLALVITLHSSLQHEVLHGHPFSHQRCNEALVFPAIGLFIPYERFRDTHLAHHYDPCLTDPYDDPETNYLDPPIWNALPQWVKSTLRFNNTLAGRMIVGPAIGLFIFYKQDLAQVFSGDRKIVRAYFVHACSLLLVIVWVEIATSTSMGVYLSACYFALSILKIRTFLEHRAHEKICARTVIIADRGPLGFLFLNNNLHSIHHAYPRRPWYQLPALYRAKSNEFLIRNESYFYTSYWAVFRQHFFSAKDPVAHPLWSFGNRTKEGDFTKTKAPDKD